MARKAGQSLAASARGNSAVSVRLRAIETADLPAVADFLHVELNSRLSPQLWRAALRPGWETRGPNHGFMLSAGDRIVGVQIAFYAERLIEGNVERFCNLSAFCVTKPYRMHGLRLVSAVLAQKGYTFTDLSPSGNVVALNARLNFRHLDTATTLVVNWPWFSRDLRIADDHDEIRRLLDDVSLAIYRDHVDCAAARHAVVMFAGEPCYIMFRRDRRKSLPLFASILFVSRPDIFQRTIRQFCGYLLLRHSVPATLLEERVVGFRPSGGIKLERPRPRMFRSEIVPPQQIDYLYSELVCIPS